jgi:LmbE family N-acetylglucosaminyl deacetylase
VIVDKLVPPASRVLIIAAHPDDETIGAAGLLYHLQLRGDVSIAIAHVTDGATVQGALEAGFRDPADYARARRSELTAAFRELPGPSPQWHQLEFGDQQPVHRLLDVVAAVRNLVETVAPGVIITHPYEGGHPDHDATAFATHAALLGPAAPSGSVRLLEMTSYHLAGESIESGEFLPSGEEVFTLDLNGEAWARKDRMLKRFATQQDIIGELDVQPHERFRFAPRYDFRLPPCPRDRVLYDRFAWPVDSTQWSVYANEAMNALNAGAAGGAR